MGVHDEAQNREILALGKLKEEIANGLDVSEAFASLAPRDQVHIMEALRSIHRGY